MKVKVISLPYIFQVLYVFFCITRPRYQVSVFFFEFSQKLQSKKFFFVIQCVYIYLDILGKELFLRDASMMDSDVQFLKQGMLITIVPLSY